VELTPSRKGTEADLAGCPDFVFVIEGFDFEGAHVLDGVIEDFAGGVELELKFVEGEALALEGDLVFLDLGLIVFERNGVQMMESAFQAFEAFGVRGGQGKFVNGVGEFGAGLLDHIRKKNWGLSAGRPSSLIGIYFPYCLSPNFRATVVERISV
jgi:hypothetical protein